jgi:hypothetical protein
VLLVAAELLTCREDLEQVAEVDTDLPVPAFVKFTMRLLSHSCKDACTVHLKDNALYSLQIEHWSSYFIPEPSPDVILYKVSHSEQDRSLPEIHFMYNL